MDNFEVILPSALLSPYIKQYWFLTLESTTAGSQRIIPNGCIGLVFHRGRQVYSCLEKCILPRAVLYGQSLPFTDTVFTGPLSFIMIVFKPAGAHLFFKIPMSELTGQYIDLETLNDHEVTELEKRLGDSTDNKESIALIESFLMKRLSTYQAESFRRIAIAVHHIESGVYKIPALSETSCLGYKQFKRIFTEHVGTNPKEFIRIVRFQRAIKILQVQNKITLEKLADKCGYYDKSHLIKDIRSYTGFTPKEFIAVCDLYSEYHLLFRSTFLDLPAYRI